MQLRKAEEAWPIAYSPPEVDRIWVIWDLIIIYPKPYSIYLRGPIAGTEGTPQGLGYEGMEKKLKLLSWAI